MTEFGLVHDYLRILNIILMVRYHRLRITAIDEENHSLCFVLISNHFLSLSFLYSTTTKFSFVYIYHSYEPKACEARKRQKSIVLTGIIFERLIVL